MICESCKFDNREGALFCAECGKPLASANPEKSVEKDVERTVILDEVVTSSKESVDGGDESESSTTVLTSNMIKPAQAAAPQGFAAAPTASKPAVPQQPVAPQMAPAKPAVPTQPAAPQMANMAPQQVAPNKPAVPQQVAPQMPNMAPQQPAAPQMATPNKPEESEADTKPSKREIKAAKKAEKKANKVKMGTGTKVYIALSVIFILALGGLLAYGYFVFHADKMEKAAMEKEELIASYTDQLNQKDTEIANANAATLEAQATISNYETKLEESQHALAYAQAVADS